MTTMSFKTFTFPHNPERITVTTETRIATAHCPEYGPIHQNLGLARRIIRAEGVFYGANAKAQYTALEALMWQTTAGNLRIPGMGVGGGLPHCLELYRGGRWHGAAVHRGVHRADRFHRPGGNTLCGLNGRSKSGRVDCRGR